MTEQPPEQRPLAIYGDSCRCDVDFRWQDPECPIHSDRAPKTTLTVSVGVPGVYKANTPVCGKCGQLDVRIPRMGIYHVCPEIPPEVKAARDRLKLQVERNLWDNINDFLRVLTAMREKKWIWVYNSKCKYVNLRVDMRDGGALLMDRDGKRIAPEELAWQYGAKQE